MAEATMAPVRSDFWRALWVTAAALIAYRLAAHIPVPGLSLDGYADLYGARGGALLQRLTHANGQARFSIVSLGLVPYFSALIVRGLFCGTPAAAHRRRRLV